MRSPALAIAWELRRRHRVALVVLATYAVVLVAVRLLILGPGRPLTLDPPNGSAVAVIVPLGTTFIYLLGAFSFGLGGDVAGRRSIFPARMFTLPVTTRALVGWPMLLGAAATASLCLVTAFFVRWSWGLDLPLVWPALLGAVFLGWTQVLMWTAYGLPGLRVLLAVLWLVALAVAVILAAHLEVPESRMVAMLAPQLPLAYLAAWLAVARARRGDVPDWRGVFPRIGRLHVHSLRRERFASPFRAQVWFEWRQRGLILPALVGFVLPFELGLLCLASDEPAVLVELTLLAVLLTPPFMAGFTAATAGPAGRDGDSTGATLVATRPLTSNALVAARLQAAIWSTLVTWLVVVAAVPLALALTGTWPVIANGIGKVAEVVGRPRAIVLVLLGFAGLLVSTWKQLVQSLCISLSGRGWVVRTSVLVRLSLLVIVWPILDRVAGHGRMAVAWLWDAAPWLLATLACVKLTAAAWVVSRLHRSRLLRDRRLVAGAALWSAGVLALYGALVWLVSTPELIPRSLLALVAILAVPLVRLAAAPLALAWGRHRGAQGQSDAGSRTTSLDRTRALRTTWALVALPLALVVAEAAAFTIRNRNNGTLVSSGREREYLLYVPRSYDPARPTPLVISMHGAGGWPAMQRDVSRWDALAESQGFLVVYPSGLRGRGPTIWREDGGSGLREDVRFISDLIDTLKRTYNIDSSRIYADGLSNGGGMAFVLSCTLSDRIAAVGLVASAQLLPFDWCTDPRAVPMVAFHGTADRMTPYHGGESWVVPRPLPDIPTFAADWSRRNRCGFTPVESAPAADVRRLEYTDCADDAAVVLYTVAGGGHTWPGGGPLPEWFVGPTSRSVDATGEIWAFFRNHPLRTR